MNETKVRISPGAESSPIRADLLQQRECAIDVSPYEILWPPDGAVHVTLGRKVYDGARLAAIEQTAQQPVVRDIALHKLVPPVIRNGCQIVNVSSVREFVQVDDRRRFPLHPPQNEVGSDKTGSAGDENRILHK